MVTEHEHIDKDSYGDSTPEAAIPTAIIVSNSSMPSETTLLTPAQTYFADEKIQIPETDHVWRNSWYFKKSEKKLKIFNLFFIIYDLSK